MAAFCTPSSVLALTIKKCKHMDEKRIMTSLPHTTLCGDIFYRYHEKIVKGDCVILGREVGQSTTFEVGPGLSVGDGLHGKALVRMTLTCANPIEVPFYSASLGRLDLCYYCGGCDGEVDQELKKQYKTVLPVCLECLEHEQPPCYRPYGKKSKSGNSQ
ncbi:hypothetical protein CI610_03768 [invertebrate metagenome]|uniref:Uncharacterized protein n=1 Tax=invertebrate metagenome TaxID=1711999 RepID=A0A2H9T276_9ZZZZ